MDYIAMIHDKLGNGAPAHIYAFKKVNAQVSHDQRIAAIQTQFDQERARLPK